MVFQALLVFYGAGRIGEEDREGRREGGHLQTLKASRHSTSHHAASLPHHASPGRSHHIPTPLLFKVWCWMGLLVLIRPAELKTGQGFPHELGLISCFLAAYYQMTIIHLLEISQAGKFSCQAVINNLFHIIYMYLCHLSNNFYAFFPSSFVILREMNRRTDYKSCKACG